jgi:hypothetical protein
MQSPKHFRDFSLSCFRDSHFEHPSPEVFLDFLCVRQPDGIEDSGWPLLLTDLRIEQWPRKARAQELARGGD